MTSQKDTLTRLRNSVDRQYARQEIIKEALVKVSAEKTNAEAHLDAATKARSLAQSVAQETQGKLQFHFSDLITKAFSAVFPDPYEYKVDFVQRRNKTECDILFKKNGEDLKPIDSSGGGPIDIASFGNRVVFTRLAKDNRPVLILDEPFKFVSSNLHDKVVDTVKLLSDKLGLQIIMVTHLPGIIEGADNVIEIENGKVVSD